MPRTAENSYRCENIVLASKTDVKMSPTAGRWGGLFTSVKLVSRPDPSCMCIEDFNARGRSFPGILPLKNFQACGTTTGRQSAARATTATAAGLRRQTNLSERFLSGVHRTPRDSVIPQRPSPFSSLMRHPCSRGSWAGTRTGIGTRRTSAGR